MRARTILDLPGRLDASRGIHSCPLSDKMFPRWALIQAQRGCYMSMFLSSFLVPPLVLLNRPNCLPAGLWTLDACHLVSLRQQDKTRWNTLTVPLTLFFQHRELLFFMRYVSEGFYRLGVTFWFLPLSPFRAFSPGWVCVTAAVGDVGVLKSVTLAKLYRCSVSWDHLLPCTRFSTGLNFWCFSIFPCNQVTCEPFSFWF